CTSGAHIENNNIDIPSNSPSFSEQSGLIFIKSRYSGSGIRNSVYKENTCSIWDWEWYIASGAGLSIDQVTNILQKTGNYITQNSL
ncbi:MAG: hypothetical protein AABY22_25500, partial [Nanoarchaeota archaeon]